MGFRKEKEMREAISRKTQGINNINLKKMFEVLGKLGTRNSIKYYTHEEHFLLVSRSFKIFNVYCVATTTKIPRSSEITDQESSKFRRQGAVPESNRNEEALRLIGLRSGLPTRRRLL